MEELEMSFLRSATMMVERDKRSFSPSTYKNYMTALRAFARFGGQTVSIDEMSVQLMLAFQRWLLSGNVSRNTSSCYMRSLRSLYNKLGGDRLPFRDVYTGQEHTRKRAIDMLAIRRLQRIRLRYKSKLDVARDIFLFSFYALGMPFVDVAYLTRSNVRGNSIVYFRHKTGMQVRVPLEPCMRDLIDKYAGRQSEFLFPILSTRQPDRAYVQYCSKLSSYNRLLKRLARVAGVDTSLSSYVVRHSWASAAYTRNIDLPVISKALGHNNTVTTQIYISEINDDRISEANHRLLNELFKL